MKTLKNMKKEIRILALSDGASPRKSKKRNVEIVGVVFRGAHWLEGVMRATIERDGHNATSNLARMIKSSRHFQQTRLIMIDGLALGGLNVVDIRGLHKKTGIPIVVVSRTREKERLLSNAIKSVGSCRSRKNLLKADACTSSLTLEQGKRPLFLHHLGIEPVQTKDMLKSLCMADIPEPIRVARILSQAINHFQKD